MSISFGSDRKTKLELLEFELKAARCEIREALMERNVNERDSDFYRGQIEMINTILSKVNKDNER